MREEIDQAKTAILKLFNEQDDDCVSSCQEVAVLRKENEGLKKYNHDTTIEHAHMFSDGKKLQAEVEELKKKIKRLRECVPEDKKALLKEIYWEEENCQHDFEVVTIRGDGDVYPDRVIKSCKKCKLTFNI